MEKTQITSEAAATMLRPDVQFRPEALLSRGRRFRVVHFLNQFFGQIGGEEKADTPPLVKEGAVGPAAALDAALGGYGSVVGCKDKGQCGRYAGGTTGDRFTGHQNRCGRARRHARGRRLLPTRDTREPLRV